MIWQQVDHTSSPGTKLTIVVPFGSASQEPANINITPIDQLGTGITFFDPASNFDSITFELNPQGLTFNPPAVVTIEIPWDPAPPIPAGLMKICHYDGTTCSNSGDCLVVGPKLVCTVNVTGFSFVSVGEVAGPSAPTVTEWGLAAMALFVFATGTLVMRRVAVS